MDPLSIAITYSLYIDIQHTHLIVYNVLGFYEDNIEKSSVQFAIHDIADVFSYTVNIYCDASKVISFRMLYYFVVGECDVIVCKAIGY